VSAESSDPASNPRLSRLGAMDFRRWRIRPKLITVVLIPTIAALLLGGLRMESALSKSASYSRLESLASALPAVDSLVANLQTERDVTVGRLITPRPHDLSGVAALRGTTDAAISAVRQKLIGVNGSHDVALRNRLRDALNAINAIASVRSDVDSDEATSLSANDDYTSAIQALNALTTQLAAKSATGDVTRRAISMQTLATVREADAQQRQILYRALLRGGLKGSDSDDLVAAGAAQDVNLTSFFANATPDAQALYKSTVGGTAVNTVSDVLTAVNRAQSLKDVSLSGEEWFKDASTKLDRIGQVQNKVADELKARIHSLGQSARNDALVSAGIIYLILAFALVATLLVARSILRPLRLLRSAAWDVAYEKLPQTVRLIDEGREADVATEVAPIEVDTRDEIGEVARAFDAVHTEAVRLAGHQTVMRGNVNKMFVNLSRRSQSLVERQLRLIDRLESSEQDSDQLANLFRLDHLATRMRRNDENLLVLAGAEGVRQRREPIPMLDILRAASAEVEQYARVRLDAQRGYELSGAASNDVVHLLAELVENATNFSPPSTLVWLRSHTVGASGEMMIEVEDQGIGMSSEELQAANAELRTPRGMDVSMTQLMGLFVIARLAQRHNILVQLRSSQSGGLTAFVRVPASLVHAANLSSVTEPPVPETDRVIQSSPIFDALQSEWFTPRTAEPAAAQAGAPAPATNGQAAAPNNWQSPGDEGWRAAAELLGRTSEPDAPRTPAGLPVRVPGRNLVPGGAASAPSSDATPTTSHRAPTDGRGLSSFQQGIHRARAAGRGNPRHGQPEETDGSEQQEVRA
jgi:signal transduction histidine kinase